MKNKLFCILIFLFSVFNLSTNSFALVEWYEVDVKTPSGGGFIYFYGVWGSSENDVYAVGYSISSNLQYFGNMIAHYDGTAWSTSYGDTSIFNTSLKKPFRDLGELFI